MFKESYFGLGRSLSKLDKWFEAIHFFKKAYKIDNKNIEFDQNNDFETLDNQIIDFTESNPFGSVGSITDNTI